MNDARMPSKIIQSPGELGGNDRGTIPLIAPARAIQK